MAITYLDETPAEISPRKAKITYLEEEPIAPEIVESESTSDLARKLMGWGLGGGAIAGAGYGIKKGYEFFRQPKVRTELKGIKEQLLDIQRQIPSSLETTQETYGSKIGLIQPYQKTIEGTEPSFIPQKLNQVSQGLKQQLNAFDETLISLNAKDLADTIKTNYPIWIKSATDTYGTGLDQLDAYFQNKPITAKVYANLLDDTINILYKKGVPINQIKPLEVLRNGIVPSNEIIIPFQQAKGNISALVNQDPYNATSGVLREKWGGFLEKNAPKEISEKLGQMNRQYQKFAQARTQLSRVVDPQTGEFNTSRLNNYLVKYTKQRVDEGIVDLMKILGEGSELTKPVSGVKEKFGALSAMRAKRFQNEDAIKQQINKINKLRSQSQELISRGKVAQLKLDNRSLAKSLTKLFGLGRKTIPFLTTIPQLIDAIRFSKDPLGYTAALGGELSQEELESARKRYQEGTMSEEEAIKLGLII